MNELSHVKSIEGTSPELRSFVAQIGENWRSIAGSIIKTSQLLEQAHEQLGNEYELLEAFLIERGIMSEPTISRLRKIGRNNVFSDPSIHPSLPPHWGTLYELAGMQETDLKNAIASQEITNSTSRAQAQELKKLSSGRSRNTTKGTRNAGNKTNDGSLLGDGPNVKLVMTLVGDLGKVPDDVFERFKDLQRDLKEFLKVDVVIDQ